MFAKIVSLFSFYVALLLKSLFYSLCSFISLFFNVQKGSVVVGSWNGDRIDDNVLGIHRAGLLNCFSSVYYLVNAPASCALLPGWIPLKKTSFAAFRVCMSAELAIYCNNKIGDINGFCITKKTRIVNVWHGSPLKKVGDDSKPSLLRSRGLGQFVFPFLNVESERWIAGSPAVAGFLSSAYGVPARNFIVRKSPRYELCATKGEVNKQVITVAPTFRADLESEELFFHTVFETLGSMSNSSRYDICVFLHPYAKISAKNVVAIANTYQCRVQFSDDKLIVVLASSVLLISDFSSVIIDACQLKIPNVSYAFGLPLDKSYVDLRIFDHVICTDKKIFSACVSVLIGGIKDDACLMSISKQQNVLRELYCTDELILPQDFMSEEIYT